MTALLISFTLKAANFAVAHHRREGVWPAEGTAEAKAGGDQPGKQRVRFCVLSTSRRSSRI